MTVFAIILFAGAVATAAASQFGVSAFLFAGCVIFGYAAMHSHKHRYHNNDINR